MCIYDMCTKKYYIFIKFNFHTLHYITKDETILNIYCKKCEVFIFYDIFQIAVLVLKTCTF